MDQGLVRLDRVGSTMDVLHELAECRKLIEAADIFLTNMRQPGLEKLGADGYMLTAVIHNWADEPARAILRRCADAARTQVSGDGRVFVVEKIGVDGRTPSPDVDIRLLAWQGGRERSFDELVSLCGDAGLALVAHHPAGSITILELAPSG